MRHLRREAEKLREQVGAISADLKELNGELSKEEDEKERLRQARQRFSDIEAEARELTRLESEIAVLTSQRAEHQREGRNILSPGMVGCADETGRRAPVGRGRPTIRSHRFLDERAGGGLGARSAC